MDEHIEIALQRARDGGFVFQGPVDIQYGFGWAPTSTIWLESRRIHLYDSVFAFEFNEPKLSTVIEVAERNAKPWVMRGITRSPDILFNIIELFLHRQVSFSELEKMFPELHWRHDTLDHDKFIPHPPDKENPGNIASLIDAMK